MAESIKHFNYEAEKELLGRILVNNQILITLSDQLSPEDFYSHQNQIIFSSMIALMNQGQAITPISLYDKLRPEIPLSALTDIAGTAAATADYMTYFRIISEHAKKRHILKILKDAELGLENESSEDTLLKLSTSIYKSSQKSIKGDLQTDSEIMEETLDSIENAIKTNNESNGMRTGIRSLDTAIKGIRKGDLILIAGRPSMGKTLLMLNMAEKLAIKYKIAIFELEMTATKLAYRRLAALSTLPMNRLYDPRSLTDGEMKVLMDNINHIAEKDRMVIDTTPRLSVEQLRNKLHYIKSTKGLDAIIIDHIGLMALRKGTTNRNDGIGEITGQLKALAKEFDISVICLSQLNRSVESRSDKRPLLSDIRDSGSLEQDSDIVMLLYRDGYYTRDKDDAIPDSEPLEVIIAKQRDGPIGTVTLKVRLAYQQITDY